MSRIANDFEDVLNYIYERCELEPPARNEEEIKDYLRRHHAEWDYGHDLDSEESGVRRVIDRMFESQWIRGEKAA